MKSNVNVDIERMIKSKTEKAQYPEYNYTSSSFDDDYDEYDEEIERELAEYGNIVSSRAYDIERFLPIVDELIEATRNLSMLSRGEEPDFERKMRDASNSLSRVKEELNKAYSDIMACVGY